jgi:hypothetical protein
MGTADFCMNPLTYVPTLVPSDVYNVTAYYTTCQGTNPIDSTVTTAVQYTNEYTLAVQTVLATSCPGDVYLENALHVLNEVSYTLTNITSELVCPPTQQQISNLFETGICTKIFRGFFLIWIGQYLSTAFLLCTTLVIAFIYQFFGSRWEAAENENSILYEDPYYIRDNFAANPTHKSTNRNASIGNIDGFQYDLDT